MVFKIVRGLVSLEPSDFFSPFQSRYDTRGHHHRLALTHVTKGSTLFHFFSKRVISIWNDLPQDVVNALTLNSFKNRLSRLSNASIIPISKLRWSGSTSVSPYLHFLFADMYYFLFCLLCLRLSVCNSVYARVNKHTHTYKSTSSWRVDMLKINICFEFVPFLWILSVNFLIYTRIWISHNNCHYR